MDLWVPDRNMASWKVVGSLSDPKGRARSLKPQHPKGDRVPALRDLVLHVDGVLCHTGPLLPPSDRNGFGDTRVVRVSWYGVTLGCTKTRTKSPQRACVISVLARSMGTLALMLRYQFS
jgi:hypothetical protein